MLFLKYAYTLFFSFDKGRDVETVEVADEFHTLSRLQSDTEYIVTIIPLYEGNTEGPVATASFKIGRCGSSSSTSNICLCSLKPRTRLLTYTHTHTKAANCHMTSVGAF